MGLKVKAIERSVSSVSVSCDSIRLKFLMIVMVTMLQKYTFFEIITKIPSFLTDFARVALNLLGLGTSYLSIVN